MDRKSDHQEMNASELEQLRDHVVICNCNRKIKGITEQLLAPRSDISTVVLLDSEPDPWRRNPRWRPQLAGDKKLHHVVGRPEVDEDLRRAGIAGARAAVILADPELGELADARSTLEAIAIERANPRVHTIMELIASINRVHLRATEINEVVCRGEVAERLIAQSCITPGIKNIFAELLSSKADANQLHVVALPAASDGKTFRQLCRTTIEQGAPFLLCGYVRQVEHDGKPTKQVVVGPPAGDKLGKDTPLSAESDQLVLLGAERPQLDKLLGDR